MIRLGKQPRGGLDSTLHAPHGVTLSLVGDAEHP